MKTHNVVQGSAEWLTLRGKYRGASEAATMMGVKGATARAEMVRMKALGQEKEFSDWVQRNLLDKGHEVEEFARRFVEGEIGAELYPVTVTDDEDYLIASLDGVTMLGDTIFECKLWNSDLAKAVELHDLPASHYWQLEQQLLVSEAENAIFCISDGTAERTLSISYQPVPGRVKQLMDGWKQFDEDVKNYQHVEVIPAPTANQITTLPALIVQLDGSVKSSNLTIYRESALAFVDRIKTDLQTDQDFADAENTIKFCDNAEKELATVKRHALGQTASIDELFKTIDTLSEAMRQKRLMLDKLVKARKETIRADIMRGGVDALAKHVAALNVRLGRYFMPLIAGNFAEVMKNKRTIQSLRDSVDGEVSRVKILANEIADRIDVNIKVYAEKAKDKEFLFTDLVSLVNQPPEAFAALVFQRISQWEEKQKAIEEANRVRIAAEERAKIEREQAAKHESEQRVVEAEARKQRMAAEAEDAKIKAAAEADARRLRKEAEAQLHEEMQTRRREEEEMASKEREAARRRSARANGREMLTVFVERFGEDLEFASIIKAVKKFLANHA